jgi:uncharacterized membrane-anchored protein
LLVGAFAMLFVSMSAHAQQDIGEQVRALKWVKAPDKGAIAGKATVGLDGGLGFLGSSDTNKFMQLTGNLPRDDSFTLASPEHGWFAVFDFVPEGYVKDDEKIDTNALFEVLKENNQRGEAERKKKGLPSLTLAGWAIPPRYDTENKRLEWATLLNSPGGVQTVNYATKLLGRSGHTSVILVSDPKSMDTDIRTFKAALRNFDYVPGERYSEWKQGDKVAAYGLGALVLGGAAAVATKKGFWAKGFWAVLAGAIGAFWKVILGVGVALLAGIGSLFKKKSS